MRTRNLASISGVRKRLISHLYSISRVAYSDESKKNMYNDGSFVAEYLDFHYSPQNYFNVPNFSETCAQLSIEACQECDIQLNNALDAGCSVGRYSFELAKLGVKDVLGVDSSERFLRIAKKLQNRGHFKYTRIKEGEIAELKEIDFQKMGLFESKEKVRFAHGDMNNYCENNNNILFDLVFAGNIICRMQDPKRFLKNVQNVLQPEGLLIITSTYSWMEAFTPKRNWIGGYQKEGEEVLGYQGLKAILQDKFIEIKKPKDLHFIIRQNEREYIHCIAEMTFWRYKLARC